MTGKPCWYRDLGPLSCRIVNALTLALILLALSVLVFSFIRSGQILVGVEAIGVFVVMPGVLVILLGSSFAFSPSLRLNVLLVLGSGLVTAWGIEALISAGIRLDRVATGRTQTVLDYVATERQNGENTFPVINAGDSLTNLNQSELVSRLQVDGSEIIPLGSIGGVRQIYCLSEEGIVAYKTDRYGYRNPDSVWYVSQAMVAVLGDSFVRGLCVDNGSTFSSLMRNTLGGGGINLGTNGTGPLFSLAALREYGSLVRPKVVIWTHTLDNDVPRDLEYERKSALLLRYMDSSFSQNLAERQELVNQLLRADVLARMQKVIHPNFEPLPWSSHVMNWLRSVLILKQLRSLAEARYHDLLYRPDYGLFKNILETAQSEVQSWGGHLYFIILPDQSYVSSGGVYDESDIRGILIELGIPQIDLHTPFSQRDSDELFDPFTGHFSPEGHRVVSSSIMEVVVPSLK